MKDQITHQLSILNCVVGMAKSRARRFKNKAWDILDAASALGLKAGVACLVLSSAYLALGFVTKGVIALPRLEAWAQHRVIANVNIATTIFDISFIVVVACLVLRNYSEDLLGYVLSLAGVGLYFGVPYAALTHLGQSAANNAAVLITLESLRTAAVFAFLPGLVLIIRDLYIRLYFALSRVRLDRPSLSVRRAGAAAVYRNPIYAKCWQMPYCSDFVRRVCPAFQRRKSCWRIKRGCRCDDNTIMAAMRDGSGDARFRKELTFAMGSKRGRVLTSADKRWRCRECSIYIEHQRQKYQILSVVVMPAVLSLIVLFSGIIRNWVGDIALFMEKFVRFASYQPAQSPMHDWLQGGDDILVLQWVFLIWFGILALSYSLQAVEYCIFKLQW